MKIKLSPREYDAIFLETSICEVHRLRKENPIEVTRTQALGISLDAKAAAELFEGSGFSPNTGAKRDAVLWRRIQKKFSNFS